MAIKAFTVGVKHHVNLGNYESMEVEAQVTMEAGPDQFQCREDAQAALKILLAETFEAQKKPAWFAEIPTKRVRTV